MFRRAALVGLAMVFVTSGLVVTVPHQTKATSGSFTLDPGEMYNLTLGYYEVDHLLLWFIAITDWSVDYSDWLEKPDGTHVALSPSRWGVVTDQAGFYMMRFSVDENGTMSTTVDYIIEHVVPSISIASPSNDGYVTELPFDISGSVDDWASSVRISLDGINYTSVDISTGDWTWQLPSDQPEGQYTVFAEETIDWGSYSARFYDSVNFTIDCTHPSLEIISPVTTTSTTYLKGLVNVSWQCSDDGGIAKREVKIDALDWQEVPTDTHLAQLPDGNHSVVVRVTDPAGNEATDQVSFVCDTVAPLVEITKPDMNSKVGKDHLVVYWTGSDNLSGIDHYEVRISGGQWLNVGAETSREFTGLDEGWYSVDVRAIDRSGNMAASTVGFGVFTSIWSQDGPYHGIPLYVLIAAAVITVLVGYALAQRRTKSDEPPDDEES